MARTKPNQFFAEMSNFFPWSICCLMKNDIFCCWISFRFRVIAIWARPGVFFPKDLYPAPLWDSVYPCVRISDIDSPFFCLQSIKECEVGGARLNFAAIGSVCWYFFDRWRCEGGEEDFLINPRQSSQRASRLKSTFTMWLCHCTIVQASSYNSPTLPSSH